jgi:hypothetical protein
MRETLTDAVETLNARRAAEAAEPASLELAQMVRRHPRNTRGRKKGREGLFSFTLRMPGVWVGEGTALELARMARNRHPTCPLPPASLRPCPPPPLTPARPLALVPPPPSRRRPPRHHRPPLGACCDLSGACRPPHTNVALLILRQVRVLDVHLNAFKWLDAQARSAHSD